jgi:hypothetical protein
MSATLKMKRWQVCYPKHNSIESVWVEASDELAARRKALVVSREWGHDGKSAPIAELSNTVAFPEAAP